MDGKPVPTGSDGTPKDFLILASAPARWSPSDLSFFDLWDPLKMGNGSVGLHTIPGGGTVFVTSTTDWSHGLGGGDKAVMQITHNVLRRLSGQQPSVQP